MTLANKIYNFIHGVKRLRNRGCENCGINRKGHIVKYDWRYVMKYVIYGKKKHA